MKFFVSVHYCKFALWPFGWFPEIVESKPMDVAIISETGSSYYAQFSSVSTVFPSRFRDKVSRLKYQRSVKDDSCKSDRVIRKEIFDFLQDEAMGRSIELYTRNKVVSFLPELMGSLPAVDRGILPDSTKSVMIELAVLAESMSDKDFDISSDFSYQIAKEDNARYTPLEKIDMFQSHPLWPQNLPSCTFDKAVWARQAYRVIKKYSNYERRFKEVLRQEQPGTNDR